MANNRLYIVNGETKEYLCIAKAFANGWQLGNTELLNKFLSNIIELNKTNLVIGAECDDDFFDNYIKDGENVNESNQYIYFVKSS